MIKVFFHALQQLGGALVFYTIVPLPQSWSLDLSRIARWATWIGLFIGLVLAAAYALLMQLPLSGLMRGVLVTIIWMVITGGLHLDGVMDTADGLAVPDPERRLAVMSDSRTGAYGVMAAIVVILLKVSAIADLASTPSNVPYSLLIAPIWGRWGQWLAIARYPYLKAEGKGAFHRRNLQLPHDVWPSLVLLAGTGIVATITAPQQWLLHGGIFACGLVLSWGIGQWFYQRLGGMTGDSYGAIVEWTEALMICGTSLLTK